MPLSEFLTEMVHASAAVVAGDAVAADGATVPDAVVELLTEPMTAAESVGTLVLATVAAQARDGEVSDEDLLRVVALAAVLSARFETYLADRSSAFAS